MSFRRCGQLILIKRGINRLWLFLSKIFLKNDIKLVFLSFLVLILMNARDYNYFGHSIFLVLLKIL